MNRNLLSALMALGLVLLLAACTTKTTEEPAAVNSVEMNEGEEAAQTAVSPDTITITDFDGRSVDVPAHPQRIVALSEKDIDAAVTLGMPLVGVVNGRGSAVPPTYLADQLGDAVSVGSFTEPSLEAILDLEPDLILIGGIFPGIADLVEPLSEIAPTVVTYGLQDSWRDSFVKSAAAMNREAEAQTWLNETYGGRVAEISEALGEQAGSSVGIVRFNPDGPVIMALGSFASLIAQDLGLVRPETQQIEGFSHSDTLSLEQIQDIDADYLFLASLNPDGAATLEAALAEPLYQSLTAVSESRTTIVDGAAWTSTGGPLAAMMVLEDIAAAFDSAVSQADTAEAAAADDAFPVTIEHKYGSTTITERPERIVTVGLTDQDALLALGIVPVGTTEWFGGYPGSIWPWAQDKVGDTFPETVGEVTPNLESMLALEPDLILALYSGIDEDTYNLLSEIAPTIAQPAEYIDYGIPWDVLTLTVGQAVGQPDEAAALVAEVNDKFAQVREAHPEFVGATSVMVAPFDGVWVYGPEDARGRFLTALGFEFPNELIEEIGLNEFGGTLSEERTDLLNVDAIIWISVSEEEVGEVGGELYQSLPVHTENREVIVDSFGDEVGGATSFISVLSLPYLLDNLVPQLAGALDSGQ